jgi:hypothetical protein
MSNKTYHILEDAKNMFRLAIIRVKQKILGILHHYGMKL